MTSDGNLRARETLEHLLSERGNNGKSRGGKNRGEKVLFSYKCNAPNSLEGKKKYVGVREHEKAC